MTRADFIKNLEAGEQVPLAQCNAETNRITAEIDEDILNVTRPVVQAIRSGMKGIRERRRADKKPLRAQPMAKPGVDTSVNQQVLPAAAAK